MKGILTTTCLLVLFTSTLTLAQTTYSSAGSGLWTTSTNWTPAGVPSRTDHVVILIGHTITVSGTDSLLAIFFSNFS